MEKITIEGREIDLYTLEVIRHLTAGKVANIRASVKLLEAGYTESPSTGEQVTEYIKRDLTAIAEILNSDKSCTIK